MSELVEKTKISKRYLSEIENDLKKNVPIIVIYKLANILGIKTIDLFSCD